MTRFFSGFKWWIVGLLFVVCGIIISIRVSAVLQSSSAYREVVLVGGYWSAEPGGNRDANTVGLGVEHCALLAENRLVTVLSALRTNQTLQYLGLKGQVVTDCVGLEVIQLQRLEELNLSGCAIEKSTFEVLLMSPTLKRVYVNKSMFEAASTVFDVPTSKVNVRLID